MYRACYFDEFEFGLFWPHKNCQNSRLAIFLPTHFGGTKHINVFFFPQLLFFLKDFEDVFLGHALFGANPKKR